LIPYGRHEICSEDIESVVDVLQSDWLTQGPTVPAFEKSVANYCGVKHARAVNSGTSALHLACLALGLGPGDRLWTTPNTFVASANCALHCGASVDFVDIDSCTYNMSVKALRIKLGEAIDKNALPKIVIPVHFAGQSCEMAEIKLLGEQYGFKIIEDASHAIGGKYLSSPIGGCQYSDITVFSFHPVKIITTGEGGMSLTNDDDLAEKMTMFRAHGITRDASDFVGSSSGPWYYEQQMLGFNYRMTDIQAALGISQLERLDTYIECRNNLAHRYNRKLKKLPLQLPTVRSENLSAFHLYVIRLNRETISKTHRQVFDELRQRDIGVNLHYMPIHLQPYYRKLGFIPGQYPESEVHGESAITLPLYSTLKEQEQDQVVLALKDIL